MQDLFGCGRAGRSRRAGSCSAVRCGGFSVVELLVVTVLAASATIAAVPMFSAWQARDRVDGAARALLASLAFARGEAIGQGGRVVVCPADATGRCVPNAHPCARGPQAWSCGWAVVSGHGRAGRALRIYPRVSGVSIAAGSAHVEFTPPAGQVIGGFRKFEFSAAGSAAANDGKGLHRCIRIAAGGRARLERGNCDGRRGA